MECVRYVYVRRMEKIDVFEDGYGNFDSTHVIVSMSCIALLRITLHFGCFSLASNLKPSGCLIFNCFWAIIG